MYKEGSNAESETSRTVKSADIVEALRRRVRPPKIHDVQSSHDNVVLRIEAGKQVTIRPRAIASLALTGRMVDKARSLQDVQKQRAERFKAEFLGKLCNHDGLRGIALKKEARKFTATQSNELELKREALKVALGPAAYPNIVSEEAKAMALIPLGRETPNGPLTAEMVSEAMKNGLASLGFNDEEIDSIYESETTIRVDEGALLNGIESGRFSLPDDAGELKQKWSLQAADYKP